MSANAIVDSASTVHPEEDNPMARLEAWLEAAKAHPEVRYHHSACLATVDAQGRPDARIVLIHQCDGRDLVFATDERSAKAQQLAENAEAALVFYWEPLERQVRIRGPVRFGSDIDADLGFADRPRGSRITAWASTQSQHLADPADLERQYEDASVRLTTAEPIARPPWWRAYRLHATSVEFWSAGRFRMHTRLRFTMAGGGWARETLSP